MPRTFTVEVAVSAVDRAAAMAEDVREGLSSRPLSIPPVWFYDELGSRLFDEITRLPEYYLTRAERSVLTDRSEEIVDSSGASTLVEIGSGTSEKTRLLLDAMAKTGNLESIVLLDISEEILREAARELAELYDVDVHAVVGDLRNDLPRLTGPGRQLWAFLGSTIGNFPPADRRRLLDSFHAAMGPDDTFLLGTDLVKHPARLLAAYDDSEGVTASFNLNVLNVLNNELGGDFDPRRFAHRAVWDDKSRWIEMRLVSAEPHIVKLDKLGLEVEIGNGEEILTEISAKFDRSAVPAELADAGMKDVGAWTDSAGDFLVTLARKAI
jgi:L-histidine N-alpha-methyltransferase